MRQPKGLGKMQLVRRIWFPALLILVCLPYSTMAEQKVETDTELPQVLYINSYNPGYSWSDSLAEGIFETLRNKATVYTEYLDAKRSDFEEYKSVLQQVMVLKYRDMPIDAVMTSDDAAFAFVQENQNTLFSNLPVVTCGINYMTPEILEECPGSTGVMEGGNPLDTAQLALELFPKTKQIVFVTDCIYGDREASQAEQITESLETEATYLFIRQEPYNTLQDIINQLKAAEKHSVVLFFGLVFEDMTSEEEAYMMQQLVNVGLPIFVFDQRFVRYGALGGIVQDGPQQGATAAKMVLELHKGTPVEQIPPVYEPISKVIFNYGQVRRFGLSNDPAIKKATIIGLPDVRINRYRFYLTIGAAFIAVQAVLIAVLVRMSRMRRRTESELEKATRRTEIAAQAKSEFLMLVSHELRTPLTAIKGFSELLSEEHDSTVRMEYIQHIKDSSEYLLDTINDILDYTHTGEGPQKLNTEMCDVAVNLAQLVSSYVPSAQKKNLDIEFTSRCARSTNVHLHWEYLELAVSKLIENSIKFSNHGHVQVFLSEDNTTTPRILAISVVDQGPGIDKSEMGKILEIFGRADSTLTREHSGIGLGLALCYRMVTAMGGTLHCNSKPNVKTEFKILLPVS